MPPFVIFALPRSRTVWLSRFLSYGGWYCGHDEALHMRSLEDVKSWLDQPLTGTVETSAAPFWRTLKELQPETRVVVIRRPVAEVIDSVRRAGVQFDEDALRRVLVYHDHKLDQIERRMGALSVAYSELATEAGCAKVFEHCLPFKHDHAWWEMASPSNLQRPIIPVIRYCFAYNAQLERVRGQLKYHTLSTFRPPVSALPSDVTIQAEPFDTLLHDGSELIRAHLTVTGEAPTALEEKNIPLFRQMERVNTFQCLTARHKGRLVGYLFVTYAPSMACAGQTIAVPGSFYVSPQFPGLGRKLQLAAKAEAVARGASSIQFLAGMRGDGPRLASLYKRLGAEEAGQLFSLSL